MEKSILMQHWMQGQSLGAALNQTAQPKERTAIGRHEPNFLMGMLKLYAEVHTAALENKTTKLDAMPDVQARQRAEDELFAAAVTRLFERVRSHEAIAIGFEPNRRAESPPHIIPMEYLRGNIDWKQNTVRHGSLLFIDVRIADVTVSKSSLSHIKHAGKKPLGRPSVEHDLTTCFGVLNSGGQIDTKASMASHYPKIRSWLEEQHPNKYGKSQPLSDEGIRKYFSIYFKELKSKPNAENGPQ